MFGRRRFEVKTTDQLRHMRAAGLVVANALRAAAAATSPGATTADVDRAAARVIADAGAKPSFLGYHGYPAQVCVSVNDEVIHGIPGPRVLAVGDLVYWDAANSLVTADDASGANELIGLAVTAAGNPSGTVNVRLNG